MLYRLIFKNKQRRLFFNFKLNYLPVLSQYHSKSGIYGYQPNSSPRYNKQYEVNPEILKVRNENSNLYRYITAVREWGHLKANTNPLLENLRLIPELDPLFYGLTLNEELVPTNGLITCPDESLSLAELGQRLSLMYCGELGIEFMHLPTLEEREWFSAAYEDAWGHPLVGEDRRTIATDLLQSQAWDHFLAVKFPSAKRYGAEGAEAMMVFFREVFRKLSQDGVEELLLGMCHRGRLNLLTGLLQVEPEVMFNKLRGLSEFPPDCRGAGDVCSHFVCSVDLELGFDAPLHVSMLFNPSHLEAQIPVACGKARGRQRRIRDGHYAPPGGGQLPYRVACVQVHGDAAISGQGIVQETLQLSEVPHFGIGGSLHLCINNQLGFTTPADRGRSSLYCTDVAKMCLLPVIHVNGDHPEAVLRGTRLAVAYNRRFGRDCFVDLVCWRRWGHNELDDPRFTNPAMYTLIDARRSVPDSYSLSLVEEGVMTAGERDAIATTYSALLGSKLKALDDFQPQATHLRKHWADVKESPDTIELWDTGVDTELLRFLGARSVDIPPGFALHPHLKKTHVDARRAKLLAGTGLDWATGEALAFASLLYQGYDVRLCGQDVGRGTFSQRHVMLVDQETDEMVIPLNSGLVPPPGTQGAFLEVANSILSEEAVLGFEYGVSIDSPRVLCVWEAQFGDFFNGAQVILDTFVSAGEEKWLTQSGLVLLLPHGYDGAGPEHSSCRLERFLQMSDSREATPDAERVNWNIVFPTTAAQIFHLLRRQMIRNFRKPLVVVGPKAILRLPASYSSLADMAPGTHFLPVIGDPDVRPEAVRKVVFVAGKHYYFLKAERDRRQLDHVALVRLEALCPFPTADINRELAKYKKATSFVWAQEEHRNMGAWTFVSSRFRNLCGTQGPNFIHSEGPRIAPYVVSNQAPRTTLKLRNHPFQSLTGIPACLCTPAGRSWAALPLA